MTISKARAFTDGACKGNPGPGGWAVVFSLPEESVEFCGYEKATTNNRMELRAVLEAIKLGAGLEFKKLDIYSDSAYVVNAIKQKWVNKWQKNNWRTVAGENVKNRDLWEQLIRLTNLHKQRMKVRVIKIKGHSGHIMNDRADELAKAQIIKNE